MKMLFSNCFAKVILVVIEWNHMDAYKLFFYVIVWMLFSLAKIKSESLA